MIHRVNSEQSEDGSTKIAYVHSEGLPEFLRQSGLSLLITSYQSGKVMIARAKDDGISLLVRNFDHPMGATLSGGKLAISSMNRIWCFENAPATGVLAEPDQNHDAYFVPRKAYVTGDTRCHELGFANDDRLIFVNTRFSCLSLASETYSFQEMWRPPFISALAPEDRCHLNGLAMGFGKPQWVTALGNTDTEQGWRSNRSSGGVVLDVATGETAIAGLSMPHSPRLHAENLWFLNSGCGELCVADPASGQWTAVSRLPGFSRGLALHGNHAYVGLSKIREKNQFGGLPITEELDDLKCGVVIADLSSGVITEFIEFTSGCEEIFEVLVLPEMTMPTLIEPDSRLVDSLFSLP